MGNKSNKFIKSIKEHSDKKSDLPNKSPPLLKKKSSTYDYQQYKVMECKHVQTNSIKNKTHATIKANDVSACKKIIKLFRIDPHEELSVRGYFWNCMHYSAHFKAKEIHEFLLKLVYICYPDEYLSIVNIKTKEGWTPAMISCIYKSTDILKLQFKYGGIDLKTKDLNGRNMKDLAKYYGATACVSVIEEYEGQANAHGIYEPNYEALDKIEDLETLVSDIAKDQEKDQGLTSKGETVKLDTIRYRELLLKGDRLPCLICLSDTGYLKYTSCCGQPMHSICKCEKIIKCPYCMHDDFALTPIVNFPERAFILAQ